MHRSFSFLFFVFIFLTGRVGLRAIWYLVPWYTVFFTGMKGSLSGGWWLPVLRLATPPRTCACSFSPFFLFFFFFACGGWGTVSGHLLQRETGVLAQQAEFLNNLVNYAFYTVFGVSAFEFFFFFFFFRCSKSQLGCCWIVFFVGGVLCRARQRVSYHVHIDAYAVPPPLLLRLLCPLVQKRGIAPMPKTGFAFSKSLGVIS